MSDFGYIPAANPRRWQSLGLGIIDWERESDNHGNPLTHIMMPDGYRYRIVRHKAKAGTIYGTLYAGNNKFMRYRHVPGENYIGLGKYKVFQNFAGKEVIETDPNGPSEMTERIYHIIRAGEDIDSLFVLNILMHASGWDIWHSKGPDGMVIDCNGNRVSV